jgi:hypothetical protein
MIIAAHCCDVAIHDCRFRQRNISAKGCDTAVNGSRDLYVSAEIGDIPAHGRALLNVNIAAESQDIADGLSFRNGEIIARADLIAYLS